MKGTFVSVWDDGVSIDTPAELDETTGEITTESVDVDDLDLDILQKECFIPDDDEDNEMEVCPECHEYILKTIMKEGIGHTLYEAYVCSNPECDNQ